MSNINELKPIQGLSPFKQFCCTIGNLPSSYLVSMTYEEQLLWLCDYLKNTVIPTVNNNAEAVAELQNLYVKLKNYVDNYFTSLDVQNEINNKLDEMATDGTLARIINQTLFGEINNDISQLFISTEQNKTDIESVDNKLENANTSLGNQISNVNNSLTSQIETINSRLDNSVSTSPIAVSSIAEMTNTSKIYVNTTDGNWYYYNTDTSTWTVGGIYQANGISENSINMQQIIKSLQSDNLFNKDSITTGQIINYDGSFQANPSYFTTDYISVKAGIKLYSNYGRIIAYYGTSKNFIKRTDLTISQFFEFTPEQDGYVRICYPIGTEDIIFISLKNKLTDKYSVKGYVDNTENLKFLTKNKNLIDNTNIDLFKIVNMGTGQISPNSSYAVVTIPVISPVKIYINNIRNLCGLDANFNIIEPITTDNISQLTSFDLTKTRFIRANISLNNLSKAFITTEPTTINDNEIFGKFIPSDIKITNDNIIDNLFGKTLYAFGDSIMYGHLSAISCVDLVAIDKKLNYTKYAQNGVTVVNKPNNFDIISQINNASNEIPDFILFDGLTNDAVESTVIGEITPNYDSELDLTTFCGCFENICRTLQNKYYSSKIYYVAVHKMPTRNKEIQFTLQKLAKQICEKYSIYVIDIFNKGGLNTYNNTMRALYSYDTLDSENIVAGGSNGNGTHPNKLGYELFYNNMIIKALLH